MAVYPSYTPISVFGVAGVAQAQYAIVNSLGYPMGSTGSISNGASRGMGIPTMIKSAAASFPQPRTINVTGNNGRKRLKFVFTAAEIGEFDMSFGAFDMNAYAAWSGTKIQTLGDWDIVGMETNQNPASVQVSLLFNIDLEAADSTNFGQAGWYNLFIPLCNVYQTGAQHQEAQDGTWTYRVSPVQSANLPWGVPASASTNGFTAAAAYGITSKNPLTMDTFVSDGSSPNVTLSYRPAEDNTGNSLFTFRNGGSTPIAASSIVIATKSLVLASNGTAGDANIIVYEAIGADLFV